MNPQPIKITKSNKNKELEIAIFNYNCGLRYVTKHNLSQTNHIVELLNFNHYMTLNGEIHVRILNNDFKLIKRTII